MFNKKTASIIAVVALVLTLFGAVLPASAGGGGFCVLNGYQEDWNNHSYYTEGQEVYVDVFITGQGWTQVLSTAHWVDLGGGEGYWQLWYVGYDCPEQPPHSYQQGYQSNWYYHMDEGTSTAVWAGGGMEPIPGGVHFWTNHGSEFSTFRNEGGGFNIETFRGWRH